jgi:uncharacterized protein YndB with AHSA1/START domain
MRWLARLAVGLVAVALLVVIVGLFLPASWQLERSIVINVPPARLYPLVATPRRWQEWAMWNRRDPATRPSFFGPGSGAGAGWAWDSRTEGKGRMTLLSADPGRGLTYELLLPDMASTSTGSILLQPQGAATRVTWTNTGSLGRNPLKRVVAAFMDRWIGPDFEAGLANLKVLAERH